MNPNSRCACTRKPRPAAVSGWVETQPSFNFETLLRKTAQITISHSQRNSSSRKRGKLMLPNHHPARLRTSPDPEVIVCQLVMPLLISSVPLNQNDGAKAATTNKT